MRVIGGVTASLVGVTGGMTASLVNVAGGMTASQMSVTGLRRAHSRRGQCWGEGEVPRRESADAGRKTPYLKAPYLH
jgi:hypothetical protein